jgi:peptidyl-prolyl cis-trans isomerase B (cyclophilin B)
LVRKDSAKQKKTARDRLAEYQARQNAFENSKSRRKKDNLTWGLIAGTIILAAIGSQIGFSLSGSGSASTPSAVSQKNQLPQPSFAQGKTWQSTLSINNIKLDVTLDGKAAPQAVSSTLVLAEKGFYTNVSCHRLTTSGIYVLQCGDPAGNGSGGPGYNYGPVENAPAGDLYRAGTIAMARQSGNASSQGSQFFIVYKDSVIPSDSAGGYTVIGHILGGLEQLKTNVISSGTADGSGDGAPKTKAVITSFSVSPKN